MLNHDRHQVLILGGGVIGVTSAYYLFKRGYEVTVIDRHTMLAQEASYANGAQLSFSCVNPLKYRDGKEVRTNAVRRYRNQLFAEARAAFEAIIDDTQIQFPYRLSGALHVFSNPETLNFTEKNFQYRKDYGIQFRRICPNECYQLEPALAHAPIAGGLYFPQDGVGDARAFTLALADWLQQRGVSFKLSTNIEQIRYADQHIEAVVTNQGELTADTYVMALGAYSPVWMKALGAKIYVVPKKGYSVTTTLEEGELGLSRGIADTQYELYYSTLGNQFRIAGLTERPSYDLTISPERIAWMLKRANNLFPQLKLEQRALRIQSCLRSFAADSTPLIGPTRYGNLYLNTGHAGFGWTLAAISGKRLSMCLEGS